MVNRELDAIPCHQQASDEISVTQALVGNRLSKDSARHETVRAIRPRHVLSDKGKLLGCAIRGVLMATLASKVPSNGVLPCRRTGRATDTFEAAAERPALRLDYRGGVNEAHSHCLSLSFS